MPIAFWNLIAFWKKKNQKEDDLSKKIAFRLTIHFQDGTSHSWESKQLTDVNVKFTDIPWIKELLDWYSKSSRNKKYIMKSDMTQAIFTRGDVNRIYLEKVFVED
jgi:hypothetical protein